MSGEVHIEVPLSKDDAKKSPATPMAGEVKIEVGSTSPQDSTKRSPSTFRRSLSNHAGQMWSSFVHHVPHPHWMEFGDHKLNRTPVTDRRVVSAYQQAAGKDTCPVTEVPPLAFTGKFAGGLVADIKRRAPFCASAMLEPSPGQRLTPHAPFSID
jgi:hypothetical protein